MCSATATASSQRRLVKNKRSDGDDGSSPAASSAAAAASPPWPEDNVNNNNKTSLLSSIYNRWTYSYMNRIFRKGAKQRHNKSIDAQLTQHDLYRTPYNDEASLLNTKFWTIYNTSHEHEHETNYNKFRITLWKLVKHIFISAGVCQLVALASQLSIPMFVMKLLQQIENRTESNQGGGSSSYESIVHETIGYVLGIFILSIVNALCTHRYQFLSYESGIIIRSR
jgi:hypothetical protein